MSLARTLWLTPLLLSHLAHADDRVAPLGAPDGEPLDAKRDVVVWHDAAFYTEPSESAPAIHVAALAGARQDNAGRVVPMHVVSTRDGFVEVEPTVDADCTASRLVTTDDVAKLRLFVRRVDLAPVLAKPFTQTFADGTSIALKAGVPVVATTGAEVVLGLRGGELVVELTGATVAHGYVPDRTKTAVAISDREYEVAPHTAVKLGDRSLTVDGRRAQTVERHGNTTLVSIESRCATIQVAAPTRSVRAVDDDETTLDHGASFGVLDLRDHDYIPIGTVLSTPSGHPIAVAAKPIYLAGKPRGKTACIDRRVRLDTSLEVGAPNDGDDHLRLCAPATRVIHEKLRGAGSANGTTTR